MSGDNKKQEFDQMYKKMWERPSAPPPEPVEPAPAAPPARPLAPSIPPIETSRKSRNDSEEPAATLFSTKMLVEQVEAAGVSLLGKEMVHVVWVVLVTALFFSLLSFHNWYKQQRDREAGSLPHGGGLHGCVVMARCRPHGLHRAAGLGAAGAPSLTT